MKPMRKRDLPFPRHWLGYIVLKIIVLGAALLFAFYFLGQW